MSTATTQQLETIAERRAREVREQQSARAQARRDREETERVRVRAAAQKRRLAMRPLLELRSAEIEHRDAVRQTWRQLGRLLSDCATMSARIEAVGIAERVGLAVEDRDMRPEKIDVEKRELTRKRALVKPLEKKLSEAIEKFHKVQSDLQAAESKAD
jgi:hypothetical protein